MRATIDSSDQPKSISEADLCNGVNVMHLLAEIDIAGAAALSRQIDLTRYSQPHVIAKFQTCTMFSLGQKERESKRDNTRSPTSLSKAGRIGDGRIFATAHDYSFPTKRLR